MNRTNEITLLERPGLELLMENNYIEIAITFTGKIPEFIKFNKEYFN